MNLSPALASLRLKLKSRRAWTYVAVGAIPIVLVTMVLSDWVARRQRLASVRAMLADGQTISAREELGRWLSLNPASPEGYYLMAKAELAAGRPQEALVALERARFFGHSRRELDLLRAVIQAHAHRFEEAEPVLRQALAQSHDPQPEVAEAMAILYLATFRLKQANEAIARWMRDAPRDPRPYLYRNEIDQWTGASEDHLMDNDRAALLRDPDCDVARIDLARRLHRAGRFAEAKAEFDFYLARHSESPEGHLGAGRSAWAMGDVEGASRHLDRCLALQPSDPEALSERAMIDVSRGDWDAALGRLTAAAKVDPYNPEIHSRLAQVLRLSGNLEHARVEDESAKRLREEHARMQRIRNALNETPGDPDLMCDASRWLLEHDRADEGLRLASQILKDRPGHSATHRLLAEHYRRSGNAGLANYHTLRISAPPVRESHPGQETTR